jgi:glyoxylase-like metal-dependent hydrolase (beta-lactamase superfamily II)
VRDEAKDAEILVHQWETGHLFGRLSRDQHRDLLLRSGVPPAVFDEMRGLYQEISLLTDALDESDYHALEDESELEFDGGSLRVLHTPGHTPGSCSFVREANRTLICGDCVLKRITPNPIVSPDPVDPSRRFPSLSEYLVSLARLREQRPTLSYGGHGEPINDFEEIFHRYVRSIDERQRKVLSLIPKEGATAFEIAAKLFPQSFNQDVHRFLAISDAIAHLDHAEREGKIALELHGGVEFYRRH